MNRQVKSRLSAVKDFLAGRSGEAKLDDANHKATRKVTDAEPPGTKSGRGADGDSGKNSAKGSNTASIFGLDPDVSPETATEQNHREQLPQLLGGPSLAETEGSQSLSEPEPERDQKSFLDQGTFDQAVHNLRAGDSPSARAAAARILGSSGSQRGTPHLIAAMFDDDPEVRGAAEEALAQLGNPTMSSSAPAELVSKEPDVEMSKLADALTRPEASTQSGAAVSSPLIEDTQRPANGEPARTKPVARDRSGRFLPVSKSTAAAPAKSETQDQGQAGSSENEAVTAVATPPVQVAQESLAFEESETTSTKLTTKEVQDQDERAALASVIAVDAEVDREVDELLLEEHAVRKTVDELAQKVLETIAAFKESETEVSLRIERERQLRTEAAERRREEEERRRRTDEEVDLRRTQERDAVAAEQAARVKAESDAQRYAEEQTNLRLKAARLRLAAEDIARRRAELETARQEAAEGARQAEVARARDEAKARHEAALKRLRSEEEVLQTTTSEVALQQANLKAAREKAESEIERLIQEQTAAEAAGRAEADRLRREADERNRLAEEDLREQLDALRQAGEEVATRRAEVGAARAQAEAEAERLVEAHVRMRAAEDARAETEAERLRLEMEINQQVETQMRLLEEMRRHGEEEQERLREEIRRRAEADELRLAEVEAEKARAEIESRQRIEKEQQIRSQIDSLRIADAETRRRIEDAESRRRAAEDAYNLVAEKVQRTEAEAHARAKEEERILAKLETERRTVAVEAQSRAEQEKRIKEEIEMFRRLEEEERPRFEEATLQLAAAEARLQERKDRLKDEGDARLLADANLSVTGDYQDSAAAQWSEPPARQVTATDTEVLMSPVLTEAFSDDDRAAAEDEERLNAAFSEDLPPTAVTPAIATYLNSTDPYKRAAAVSELARSGGQDAFGQIVECFDDHSPHVRNAAARALRKLEPDRTVDLFNRALEEASDERRRSIGGAIAASGLATEAIDNLTSENREDTYNALSILFVMAKTGEVEPLYRALEEHRADEIGKAVTKLLTLSGHQVG